LIFVVISHNVKVLHIILGLSRTITNIFLKDELSFISRMLLLYTDNYILIVLCPLYFQREIMEGRMERKRGIGRPRQKIMDWMMKDGYGKLK